MAAPLVIPKARFFTNDGLPLVGGKLYSYAAGTSTPKVTYASADGVTQNANPVILDANGEADIWLAGSYKLRLLDADDVEQWVIDNVKEQLVAPAGAFTLVSSAPTVVNATTFSLVGDQTPYFFVNQRVKFVTTTTTVYARVISAVLAAGVTTVVLSNGAINVGAPTGVYAGLGNVGLPIDARHVAYGTTQTLEEKILDMEADFNPTDGGVIAGPVTFGGTAQFDGYTQFTAPVEFTDLVTVSGVLKANILAEGDIDIAGNVTDMEIPAGALARIAAGEFKKLKVRVLDLKAAGDVDDTTGFSMYVRCNASSDPNYAQMTVVINDTPAMLNFYQDAQTELLPFGALIVPSVTDDPTVPPVEFEIDITGLVDTTGKNLKFRQLSILPNMTGDKIIVDVTARWVSVAPLNLINLELREDNGPGGATATQGTWQIVGEP